MSIELTIDGTRVTGRTGQTILNVAEENGIHIPTLCTHPRLEALGACRMCVVDVGRRDRLEAACTTPIVGGMTVKTANERVMRARRIILEILISTLSADVRTVEKDGRNVLMELANELGVDVDEPRFPDTARMRDARPIDDRNPVIIRDPNKCILCGRCVSACNDLRHYGVLNFEGRGFKTSIVSGLAQTLLESGCTSCGECVDVCPTGSFGALSKDLVQGEIDNVIATGLAFPVSTSTHLNRSKLGLPELTQIDASDLAQMTKRAHFKDRLNKGERNRGR